MKIVLANGTEYNFHFRRETSKLPLSLKDVPGVACILHLGPCASDAKPCGTEPYVIARTWVSPKDVDRPHVGNKIALSRALIAMGLDKMTRKDFWDRYYLKMSKPRSRKRK